MSLKIGVVVGELSGDKLAAGLIKSLKQYYPHVEVEGVAGPNLVEVGCEQLYDFETLAVMGLVEPLLRLRQLWRMRQWLINYFLEDPPDLFIGVDAPDFNLGLEKKLKAAGIPTVHYISPSVWAWRQGRIHSIKQAVDLMLTVLPFETNIYKKHAIAVKFIGHPAADRIPLKINKHEARARLQLLHNQGPILAVLPGSRVSELTNMLPTYLQTLQLCVQSFSELQIIMPLVKQAHQELVESFVAKNYPDLTINYFIGNSDEVISAADVALVTSGTAALEIMLHQVPMVVGYKTNWMTYHIVKRLIKVSHISLPNLIADAALVPELIQYECTAQNLFQQLQQLLSSETARKAQTKHFLTMHKELRKNASEMAAQSILDLLGDKEIAYANRG